MNASEIAYTPGGSIKIKGNMIFDSTLTIMNNVSVSENGTINHVKLSEEIVEINSNKTYESKNIQNN